MLIETIDETQKMNSEAVDKSAWITKNWDFGIRTFMLFGKLWPRRDCTLEK